MQAAVQVKLAGDQELLRCLSKLSKAYQWKTVAHVRFLLTAALP